jgi:hypothetical protein
MELTPSGTMNVYGCKPNSVAGYVHVTVVPDWLHSDGNAHAAVVNAPVPMLAVTMLANAIARAIHVLVLRCEPPLRLETMSMIPP